MTQTTPTRDEAVLTGWNYDLNKQPNGLHEVAFDGGLGICNVRICERYISGPTLIDGYPVPVKDYQYAYREEYGEGWRDVNTRHWRAYAWRHIVIPPMEPPASAPAPAICNVVPPPETYGGSPDTPWTGKMPPASGRVDAVALADLIDSIAKCRSENAMDQAFLDNSDEIAEAVLKLFADRDGEWACTVNRLEDRIEGLNADLESAVEVAFRRGATEWTRLNYPTLHMRLSEPASLSPAATPVSEAEPVAWRYRSNDKAIWNYCESSYPRGVGAEIVEPLYAALDKTASSRVREALEFYASGSEFGPDRGNANAWVKGVNSAGWGCRYAAVSLIQDQGLLASAALELFAKPASSPAGGDVHSDLVKRLNALVARPGRDWRTGDEFIHGVHSQDIVDIIREAAAALSQSTSAGRVGE